MVGVALVCTTPLPLPLRCFKTFLEVWTVADDVLFSIVPRVDVAAFLDATFIFLVVISTLGVARDFVFIFFVPILAGADAVIFCFFDVFLMCEIVVGFRCESEC